MEGELFVLVLNQICPETRTHVSTSDQESYSFNAWQNSPLLPSLAAPRPKTCIFLVETIYFSPLEKGSNIQKQTNKQTKKPHYIDKSCILLPK